MNTISGLLDVIDDPPMRYGFIVICTVVILWHLAFVKNLKVDFLLFRVAEGNMEAVFRFVFELVDKNELTFDFVVVLFEKIVC